MINYIFTSGSEKPLNLKPKDRRYYGCPFCSTTDCVKENLDIRIEGPGIIKTDSKSILKTCNARRQLKILKEASNGR